MSKKSSEIVTKSENKQAVFRFIMQHGPVTKQDLYIGTNLSLPTIKQALAYLDEHNLIEASDIIKNTGGRNAIAYNIASPGRAAIGTYFSAHHLTAVCIDLNGDILASRRIPIALDLHSDIYLKRISDLIEEVKNQARIYDDQLIGVGLAIPSLISDDGEAIIHGIHHDFSGITRKRLSKYIPYPTMMIHDSYGAGFAEVWKTTALENAVFINLNNNIGSCIIIDKKIYLGKQHLAGELGHIIVDPNSGIPCHCGQKGCFDTVCNAAVLSSRSNNSLDLFFDLLRQGDTALSDIWNTYLDHLALAIHNLIMMFDCPVIVGGYVGTYIEEYLDILRSKVNSYDAFSHQAAEYVLPCRYKKESAAVGAAIQVIEKFIHSL